MQMTNLSHKNYEFYKIYKRKFVKIKNLQSNKNLSCVIFHPLQKPALCLHNASAASPLTVGKCFARWENYSYLLPTCFLHVNERGMRTIYITFNNKFSVYTILLF